jgi:hypothetical protein
VIQHGFSQFFALASADGVAHTQIIGKIKRKESSVESAVLPENFSEILQDESVSVDG